MTKITCPMPECGKSFEYVKSRGKHLIVTCPWCGEKIDIGTHANVEEKNV